jgi:hypothetical protein
MSSICGRCLSGTLEASERNDTGIGVIRSSLSREVSAMSPTGGLASEREQFVEEDERFARERVLADGLRGTDDSVFVLSPRFVPKTAAVENDAKVRAIGRSSESIPDRPGLGSLSNDVCSAFSDLLWL